MIRDVIILKRSGEVLVRKDFAKRGVDEAIFSGFYSAISAFAEELGEGGIETIQMGDVSFFCHQGDDILFTIAADKNYDPQVAQKILKEIKQRFLSQYGEALKSGNGDSRAFSQFSKDVGQLITETAQISAKESLLAIPFALDGSYLKNKKLDELERDSKYILDRDRELAAVHLLLENIRQSNGSYKSLKEGCYEFLVKLFWPIWVEQSPDGQLLLIDGLKLIQPNVLQGFVPPASRYEALLKVESSREYIAVLEKLEEEVRTAARSTPFDSYVIPWEFSQLLQNLSILASEQEQIGVQLPSQLTKKQVTQEAQQFQNEAIATHEEAAMRWTQFLTEFKEKVQRWIERIKEEITTLEEHYDSQQIMLKTEIDKALTELAKQEEEANAKIDDWRLEQEHKLILKLKASLKPLDKQISQQRTTLSKLLSEKAPADPTVNKFIEKLLGTLDTFDKFVSDLRTHSKTTKKTIHLTQKALSEISLEAKDRKNEVRQRYKALERKEIDRLEELKAEREARIQKTKERLTNLDRHATQIESLIQEHISYSKGQLEAFEHYLLDLKTPFPMSHDVPLYVPIYIAGLKRLDGSTHIIVIPPLQVPSEKKDSALIQKRRSLPITELATQFVTYMKDRLEEALKQDLNFSGFMNQIVPQNNLLTSSNIESLLYSGLHALWQSQLISERTHTQVKLVYIEVYRTLH
jgi:hypothetical protein